MELSFDYSAIVKVIIIITAIAVFVAIWHKIRTEEIGRSRFADTILPTSQVGNGHVIYITPPARRDPLTLVRPPPTPGTNMTQIPMPQPPATTTEEIAPLPLYSRNDDLANSDNTTATTMCSAYPILNAEDNPEGGMIQGTESEPHFPSMPPPAYSPSEETSLPISPSPSLQSPPVSNETGTPSTVQASTHGLVTA